MKHAETPTHAASPRALDFYRLEERVLLDASGGEGIEAAEGTADAGLIDALLAASAAESSEADPTLSSLSLQPEALLSESANSASSTAESPSPQPTAEWLADGAAEDSFAGAAQRRLEVIVVDAAVEDPETLIAGLRGQDDPDLDWLVVRLTADGDALAEISAALATVQDVDAVHILSHGDGSSLQLGGQRLTSASLAADAGAIARWSDSLSETADLLIYGCSLASTAEGQELLESFAALTGADVAASDDPTGHSTLAGDWDLEYAAGDLQTEVAFTYQSRTAWNGLLATLTVTNTNDSGAGSLRQAIADANAMAGTDTIEFNISTGDGGYVDPTPGSPASGDEYWTIAVLSYLGNITDTVIIDATTQPGYGGTPVIELDGSGAGGATAGLLLRTSNSTIRGLSIHSFADEGVELDGTSGYGDNNLLEDSWIGVTAAGVAVGNGDNGVLLYSNSQSNTIRNNVISGNGSDGIEVQAGGNDNNWIYGNTIGLTPDGLAAANGSHGIQIGIGASGNIIGTNDDGTNDAAERNIISGNSADGIYLDGAVNTVIKGNLIGTDATGTVAIGNGDEGISVQNSTSNTTIGGSNPAARNLISGNAASGLLIQDSTSGTIIQGNYIGTDITGTLDLGNAKLSAVGDQSAIRFVNAGAGNSVGGTSAGQGNLIAFNTLHAVEVIGTSTGITIRGNSIHSNTGLAIDLDGGTENASLVTANDAGDADAGANDLQNFPVLTDAQSTGSTITITGSLQSTAGRTFRIEFFANSSGTAGSYGEGETYLGFANVTTDGLGDATINTTLAASVGAHDVISATATDLTTGSTSEFAVNIESNEAPTLTASSPVALYTENGTPFYDSSALATDADSINFDGGVYTLALIANGTANDRLGIRNVGSGAGQISTSGSNVLYQGVVIGTFSGGTDGSTPLAINLNANATGSAVQALSRAVTYHNVSENPSTATRTLRATLSDGDGGTSAAMEIDINVSAVNDAPLNTVPGGQTTTTNNSLVFSSGNGNLISISDVDAGSDPLQVTLSTTNGTLTLITTAGLSFSSGDGSGDTSMTLTGTAGAINTALNGLIFAPTSDFNGTATLQIVTNDQGNNGTGGALSDTDSVAITINPVNKLWLATAGDVAAPSGASGLASWTAGTALELGGSTLGLEPGTTSGTFSPLFNLDAFAANGDTSIDAIHYVSQDITVGTFIQMDLLAGDVLLSTAANESFSSTNSLAVESSDVFVFRPDTVGDYSAGTFRLLIDGSDLFPNELHGISLVEQDVVVGDVTLNTGDFLLTQAGNQQGDQIYRWRPTSVGTVSNGNVSVLVDGGDISLASEIVGIDVVENDVVIGGRTFTAGQLLVSLSTDDNWVGDNGISTTRNDIFVLDVTAAGSTTTATATLAFQGADVGLNTSAEGVGGLTLFITQQVPNQDPIASDDSYSVNEGSPLNVAAPGTLSNDADPDGDSTVVNLLSGPSNASAFQLNADGSFSYTHDGSETLSDSFTYTVSDGKGGTDTGTVNLAINPVNDAPLEASIEPAALAYTENDPATSITSTLTLSDSDDTQLESAIVQITNNYASGEDLLAFTDTASITGSWNAATGTLTLIGSDTFAAYQAALRSVTYRNTSENPSTATRTVSLTTNDGDANSNTLSRSIAVTATNDSPAIATNTGTTVNEGSTGNTLTSAMLNEGDPDDSGTGLTYTITAATSNGTLRLNGTAFGANDTFTQDDIDNSRITYDHDDSETTSDSFTFSLADGGEDGVSPATGTFNLTVTPVNDNSVTAVTDANAAANEIDENAAIGTAVGVTALANDADATDSVTYSLDDDAAGRFAIDANTGVVTLAAGLDYESNTSHTVTVRATSSDGTSSTENFSINVNDINEAAATAVSDTDAAANTVAENAAVGTTVGVTASSSDADGTDSISYSLDDDDGGRFAIDANTGAVTVAGGIDREADGASRSITIRATSSDGSSTTESFSIAVTDVDEFVTGSVTDANAAANEIDENAAIGSAVGVTALATDADATDSVTYSLDDDAAGRFAIDTNTGVVTLAAGLDYESNTSHTVTVRATSSDGTSSTENFSINVNDINEAAATAVSDTDAAANTVAENAAVGTTIGVTASSSDADGTDSISYSLDDDDGGRFAIDANTGAVTVAGGIDRETDGASRSITIRATSSDGSSTTESFSIAVSDVDEFVTGSVTDMNAAANEIDENAAIGSAVGVTALATDADATDSVTYSLDDDAAGRFAIDANTGLVTLAAGLDYESNTSHTVTVRATSSDGTSSTENFSINVNDINETAATAVSDTDAAANTVAENAAVGTTVGVTASSSDADGTDSISYSLDDDDGGRFAIDANTGAVTVAGGIDREADGASRSITIRATSSDGSSTTEQISIALTDVNESAIGPIGDSDAAVNEIDENAAIGSVVGVTALANDSDTTDSVSYSLDDDADGRFAIDANTGEITLAAGLDYESSTSHTVTVRATSSDLSSSTRSVTIAVQDQNDIAPTVTAGQVLQIGEAAADGQAVGTVLATDVDTTGSLQNWTIVSGDPAGIFAIDPASGLITIRDNATLDFETVSQYELEVHVSDGSQQSATATLTVQIQNVNEAPSLNTNQLAISEGGSVVLSAGDLQASDVDTASGTLQFQIASISGGHFERIADPGTPITEFYQSEVNSGSIRFVHDGGENTPAYQVTVNDGSLSDGPSPASIQFLNGNDAPTLTASAGPVVYVENAPAQSILAAVSITDPDHPLITSATVSLGGYVSGEDQLQFTATEWVSGSWDSVTGTLTLSGAASAAQYQSALETVSYVNSSETPSSGPRSLAVTVHDGIAESSVSVTSLQVISVNDTPVATSDTYTTRSNESIVLDASGVVSNDFDTDGDVLFPVISIAPRHGQISVDSQGQWVYTPTPGFFGIDIIEYQASDGQASSATVEIRIEVTAVGGGTIAPPAAPATPTTAETDSSSPTNESTRTSSTTTSTSDTDHESEEKSPAQALAAAPLGKQNSATQWMPTPTMDEAGNDDGDLDLNEGDEPAAGVASDSAHHDVSDGELRATRASDGRGRLNAETRQEVLRSEVQQSIAWGRWDGDREAAHEESGLDDFAIGSVDATAAFVSIGYVMWTLRGGLFVTSMFGSLPAWRMIDPTSLLVAYRNRQPGDGDTIENLIK